MENKKPNVFPSNVNMEEAIKQANETGTKIAEQAEQEASEYLKSVHKTEGEMSAEAQMKQNTINKLEEQLARREAYFARKRQEEGGEEPKVEEFVAQPTVTYAKPEPTKFTSNASTEDKYTEISRPRENEPYDVLKLPSGGLIYKNHKGTVDVSFLTAADEDIITNPNLLQSGKFLEILINRKLLNTPLRYKDLHVGDRNAIMLWLRSTGYGPMYNIKLSDPNDPDFKEFEVEIDLSKLPTKPLGAKPDENGLFEYTLPMSKHKIKFKLLTVGDVDDIEDHVNNMDPDLADTSTYTLKKQIVEYNGETDPEKVEALVSRIILGDVHKFREYVEEIESGIDMNLTVRTPGGESLNTFLPLNLTFFWPNLGL